MGDANALIMGDGGDEDDDVKAPKLMAPSSRMLLAIVLAEEASTTR